MENSLDVDPPLPSRASRANRLIIVDVFGCSCWQELVLLSDVPVNRVYVPLWQLPNIHKDGNGMLAENLADMENSVSIYGTVPADKILLNNFFQTFIKTATACCRKTWQTANMDRQKNLHLQQFSSIVKDITVQVFEFSNV